MTAIVTPHGSPAKLWVKISLTPGEAELTIVHWLKRPGDLVAIGEPLLVAVNDRVEALFPATSAGVLEQVLVAEGERTQAGAPVAVLQPALAAPNQTTLIASAANQIAVERPDSVGPVRAGDPSRPRAISPVARRIAMLAGMDMRDLPGSGPSGRVMKADVLAALAGQNAMPGERRLAPFGAGYRSHAPYYLPDVSLSDRYVLTAMEIDMGRVAAACARLQVELQRRGPPIEVVLVAQAAVAALLRYPLLNSAWADDAIIVRRRVHLRLAGPSGALAVVRDAQDLNARGLARARASERPETYTFSITDFGDRRMWGMPPLDPQQSAALGVAWAGARPVVIADGGVDRVVIRPVALLTLAYDARVIDQCYADLFLRDIKSRLERGND